MVILKVYDQLCKGVDECGICIHVCTKDVFKPSELLNQRGYRPPVVINPTKCTACESCMIYCPDLAIVISGENKRRRVKNEK